MARTSEPLHRTEHFRLLEQFTAGFGQVGLRMLQPGAQDFGFRQVLHGDQNAADACAVRMDLPGQHQPPVFTQHMAAFQRLARSHHGKQLLVQVGARQHHEHPRCRNARRKHRTQPLQPPRRRIGREQAQLRAINMKTQQRDGNRIKHALQAGLHRQQSGVVTLGSRVDLEHRRGCNHAGSSCKSTGHAGLLCN